MVTDVNEFMEVASLKDTETFSELAETWHVDKGKGFEWLRRCEFRTESKQSIEEAIAMHGRHVLRGDSDLYPTLSDYLVNNLNAGITTENARKWIRESSPFTFRAAALDPTLCEKIGAANQRYLESYTPFGVAGHQIVRAEASTVVEHLQAADSPSLILLTGEAGSGKSGVVREVMGGLTARSLPHLAFRIDRYLSCRTRHEIGSVLLDLDESPVSALVNLAEDGPAVLIVDQIDAISEISGRTGTVKDILFELIREARRYGDVRCLLVCRSFDLENDPQYRDLEERHKARRVQVPHLSWEHEVAPILERAGIATGGITEIQRKLLALPINLSIFLEIADSAFSFATGTALMQSLLKKKTRELQNSRSVGWSVQAPLSAMAEWMSDKQRLSCPDYILDDFDGAKDWLSSENLIIVEQNRLAFFHESFFDFIFARTFARFNRDIADFLTSTEQHLFRRTQVRQILTLMRDMDKTRYLKALETVLSHRKVRLHVKHAVAQWFAALDDPTPEELRVILRLDQDSEKFPVLVRKALFVSESWFDLLNADGELSRIHRTAAKQRRRYLLPWLRNVADKRPGPVATLLRDWWNRDPTQTDQLMEWFGYFHQMPADRSLTALLRDVIRSEPGNLSPDRWKGIVRLLHSVCEVEPEASSEILQALFVRWFRKYPGKNPFTHHGTREIEIPDLAILAKRAPSVFLDGMIPALVESVQIASSKNSSGEAIHVLSQTSTRGGPDALFSLYRDAFRSLAETAPQEATGRLDRLDPAIHEVLLHLHLETIGANPTHLGHRFAALLDGQHLFLAGFHGAEWQSFAESARSVVAAGCLPIRTIENKVFRHRPEHDLAKRMWCLAKDNAEVEPPARRYATAALARSGHVEWCVLRMIGGDLLSSWGKGRLAELDRKFFAEGVPEPHVYEATSVGSPIPSGATRRMTDEQWLSAIEKYAAEYENGEGLSVYGMFGLAQELERVAKSDPSRFARFFLRLREVVNPEFGRRVLEGLASAEKVDKDATIAALRAAHAHRDRPFGLQIVRVVDRHPVCLRDDDIFEALLWYSEHGEASENQVSGCGDHAEEFPSIDDLVGANDALLTSGINSVRGAAWWVLGRLIESDQRRSAEIQALVECRAGDEPSVPVRAMMLYALTPLFNLDRTRFGVCLRRLTEPIAGERDDVSALAPIATELGVRLFPYIERDLPDLALELMGRMIDSSNRNLHLIGTCWVLAERLRQGNSTNRFPYIQRQSPVHAKLWGSILCEFAEHTEFRDMAVSEIEGLFFHEAPEVRQAAAGVFLDIPGNDFPHFMNMVQAFVRSPSFKDAAYPIIKALEGTSCDVTELVIEVGEILVRDRGDGPAASVHYLQGILKREYVNSEGRPELRKRFLDLFDYMAGKDIYEADDLMKLDDRW